MHKIICVYNNNDVVYMEIIKHITSFLIQLFSEEPENEYIPINIVQKIEYDEEQEPVGLPIEWLINTTLENKVVREEK